MLLFSIRRLSISIIKNAEDMFTTTFVIIWFGGAAVSLNAQLLGGKMYEEYPFNFT